MVTLYRYSYTLARWASSNRRVSSPRNGNLENETNQNYFPDLTNYICALFDSRAVIVEDRKG